MIQVLRQQTSTDPEKFGTARVADSATLVARVFHNHIQLRRAQKPLSESASWTRVSVFISRASPYVGSGSTRGASWRGAELVEAGDST